MLERSIQTRLQEALADTPAVVLQGPRQVGKTTLVRRLVEAMPWAEYSTFDDFSVLAAAREDPEGFLLSGSRLMILDEVQRAPEIFLPLKRTIDEDRRPGRFLLTGSAKILLIPELADYLVGRMELLTLLPFSQGELLEHREGFVDRLFTGVAVPNTLPESPTHELLEKVLAGGFPEAVARRERRRDAWFRAYVQTLLQREVRDLAQVRDLTSLPRLLTFLASRTSSLLNHAEVARTTDLSQTTVKRYLTLLEGLFLVERLPAWSSHHGKRWVKAPKLCFLDSGVAAHLLGATPKRLAQEPLLRGKLVETFVAGEIRKQLGWSQHFAQMFHCRSHNGKEIDLVLEDAAGRVVGLEVKTGRSVATRDFRGLKTLAETLGDQFLRGVVLYGGSKVLPFGPNLEAIPLSALWS